MVDKSDLKSPAPTMRDFAQSIRRQAAFDPDRIAIRYEADDPISYRDFDWWIDRIAHQLRDHFDIARGDRVAWLGFNHPALVATMYACARIGAIFAPINWRLSPPEIAYIIADCTPKILIYGEDFVDIANESLRPLCETRPIKEFDTRTGDDAPFAGDGRLSDTLLIVYTSGTTGRPKGAMLSQEAVYVNAINSIDMHEIRRSDSILVCLPLFHVGGLNVQMTPGLFIGAEIILHEKFDPVAVDKAIINLRPDLIVLVPVMLRAILDLPEWETADYSCLRTVTTGSSVIPPELIAPFEEKGLLTVQIYGSTETCPLAVYTRPGLGKTNPRCMGTAALLSEARLVDPEGEVITAADTDGEIEIRGRHVMQGYWNNEKATRDAFHGRWFRTGDIGRYDADKNLYFQDRRNNLIVSGGENIYPAEVERVLSKIPGMTEVSVVGIPDDQWGQVPVAVVIADETVPPEEDILAQLGERLARYKVPREIIFTDELPRNAMGKVVAEKVREFVLGGAARK
jgi:fatty-acyl-CoA synthase